MGFIICGTARHGKDTAAEIVQKYFNLSYAASSEFACDLFLFEKLKDEFGYTTKEQCFEDRVNHRQRWFDEIVQFNTPDLGRLGELIFEKNDVYCGIRNLDELDVLREKGLVKLVIWVDASERLTTPEVGSNTITKANADIIIENNGTLAEFEEKVFNLFSLLTSGKGAL